ncbi:MAG: imidazole glycerol phosphate synthase subunit HisH [Rhodospirillales bacterium]|nr:imidazole glycerol phosphate synthase subunit HisH [Rhodospirillales bacterium]
MDICVVDYGSGNLRSAAKALERSMAEAGLHGRVRVTAKRRHIQNANRIVLPGVGAFADCQAGIQAIPGLWQDLDDAVRRQGKPLLGICVGMQLMAEVGREFGDTAGFGWIGGQVAAITPSDPTLKIPHMGWNNLSFSMKSHPLLEGINAGAHAYFVHSYSFTCKNPDHQIATVDYGGPVIAAIARDNVAGTQFHPEKSQAVGLRLLTNFLKWTP